MRRLLLACCALVALAGCDRCGGGARGKDAGSAVPDAGVVKALHATDLRSALILIHPEFRYSRVSGELAGVERDLAFPEDRPLLPALRAGLAQRRFTDVREEDGVVRAVSPPLTFEARREGGAVTVGVYLPLDEDAYRKLLHSPSPMGSEHLSSLLASPEGGRLVRERFVLNLRYGARPDHASILIRRLVEGLLETRWEVQGAPSPEWEVTWPDGGTDTVPHELDMALEQQETGGVLVIDRQVGRVRLLFTQPLVR